MSSQPAGAETVDLSERIKLARGRAGLTQRAFADAVGVDSRTVGNWENRRSTPRAVELAAIERVLAERGIALHPTPTRPVQGVELAVLDDSNLTDRGKTLLIALYRELVGVENDGEGRSG